MKNRVIKFRLWFASQMFYNIVTMKFLKGELRKVYVNHDINDESQTADTWTGQDDYILMQYATKLFSGLELWEGDIISYKAGGQEAGAKFYEFMGVVKFRNGGFCIYSNNSIRTQIPLMDINGNDEFLWYESGSLANSRKSYYMCKDFKVVGNIYENGCDTCKGQGFYEVYHDDSEIIKGEATCLECNGTGFVIEEE